MNEEEFNELDLEDDNSCTACGKKKKACISFFAHENDMMHKDMDNERAHRTTRIVCLTFIIITAIFVFAYTSRMNSFIHLIKEMNAALIELANANVTISP